MNQQGHKPRVVYIYHCKKCFGQLPTLPGWNCHLYVDKIAQNVWHQYETPGIPTGLDISWWHFKSRLTGCAGEHILSLVQPRGFSQKAQADRWLKAAVGRPKENYLKTAEKNALRKATPTQLLPETRLQRYSEFKNLLSLCCENTQRITCVELALLKPPQAAALYVWPVPGAVGQGCCWRVSKVESSVGLG